MTRAMIQPGDEVMVRGDLVGRQSNVPVRCLVVARRDAMLDPTSADLLEVRAERCTTRAERAAGDYERWSKRGWWLRETQVARITH